MQLASAPRVQCIHQLATMYWSDALNAYSCLCADICQIPYWPQVHQQSQT